MSALRSTGILALGLAIAGTAHAADPVGLAFLKIGAGADAVGMGEAVVSNVDGPVATYWNPGALAILPGFQATVVHNESFSSVRQEFASATRSFGQFALGASFNGSWTDDLRAYDESANFLGHFGYYGMSAGLSAAYRMNDRFGAGVTMKYLREAFDVYDASGVGFDVGVAGRGVLPRVDVGFAILHLGSDMTYIDSPFRLPRTLQGGITYHIPLDRLGAEALLAAEVRQVRDEDAGLLLGFEYRLQEAARLRVGYRSGLETEDLSFGLGLGRGALRADYAYVPFDEDLGDSHRIGLSYKR